MAHTLMIVSNFCTSNIEDIARQNPNAFLMLHIYLQDIDIIKNMIRTAEKCNFKGIVLTMNSADDGKYNSDGENNYQLLKSFKKRNVREVEEDDDNNKNHNNNDDDARSIITNISSATIHAIPLSESINENLNQDIELDSHITWNTIKELKSLTRLPIIIKGISTLYYLICIDRLISFFFFFFFFFFYFFFFFFFFFLIFYIYVLLVFLIYI